MTNSLKEKYEKEITAKLIKEFSIENKMAAPKVIKVVVNAGIGELSKNKQAREQIIKDMAIITGQQPSIRPAKTSVAGFGIRTGMPVGIKVTLRGKRMYDFMQKLFSIVLPRLRDFRGVSLKSFDKHGNYTLGISDHTVFPEIDTSETSVSRGLEVTIATSAKEKKVSKRLLELLGMPFEKEEHGKKSKNS